MPTITQVQLQNGQVYDLGGGGGTYTLSKSGDTITLTGSGGDTSSVTDANTTYTFTINSDGDLVITSSDGTSQTITLTDTWQLNTKTQEGYVLAGGNNSRKMWMTDENGNPQWDTNLVVLSKAQYDALSSAEQNNGDVYFVYDDPGTAIPVPTSTTPLMDGTASVGSEITYARGDHRHPSDTSKQDRLISGTNIKTINGTSILGSGDVTVSTENEIFVATYNVTPIEDIIEAYNDGKTLIVHYTLNGVDYFAPLQSLNITDDTHGTFQFFSGDVFQQYLQMPIVSDDETIGTRWRIFNYNLQPKLVSGTNIKTINSESLLGSGNITVGGGGSQNIWYATCSTASGTLAKVATTTSGDFVLAPGNMVRVKFSNGDSSGSVPTLNVDNTGDIPIVSYSTTHMSYSWGTGEVIDLVYDGNRFTMSRGKPASTTYYGVTKLSSSVSSTSTSVASTPSAVKMAYDEATDATATPTADKKSKFDSSAHMNSTDMTTGSGSELEDFIDGLNVSGGSAFLDMFYPVGSYYETSNASFDPNVTWGGTWVLETEGQVHVSAGANYDVGDTGGEATHTLTVNEMPHHRHDIALYGSGYSPQSVTRDCITTNAWSNRWSLVGDYMDGVGRNDAHNNMQPYIVVNRWHRTA